MDERGLHDESFAVNQCNDCNDQLNGVTIWVRNGAMEGDKGQCKAYPNDALSKPPIVSLVLELM